MVEACESEHFQSFLCGKLEAGFVIARERHQRRSVAMTYTHHTNILHIQTGSSMTSLTLDNIILLDFGAIVIVQVVSAHPLHFRCDVLRKHLLKRLRLRFLHLKTITKPC